MVDQQSPILETRDLAWTPPGADAPLWRGVNMDLNPGELVVLDGPSGCGKSTMLRCIVGLDEVSAGDVLWRGESVTPERIRRFRHQVVYIHQTPVSIAATIEENLRFPQSVSDDFLDDTQRAMTDEEQRDLLAQFQLPDLDFSRRFDGLSVGEQQRLAFVRCMSVRPQVILLDEPTASLDSTNARRIESFVLDYLDEQPDRAAIWISHDREQRERLNGRVLNLDEQGWLSAPD